MYRDEDPAKVLQDLELKLRRISDKGELRQVMLYFGVQSDPFIPFNTKFDLTVKALRLFERYTPGLLVIQTRSPLVVIALSTLKQLADKVVVTLGIETSDEDVVSRYTPGLPGAGERFRAASALKNFGIEVMLQVAPLLPYGHMERGALGFANLIDEHCDSVKILPIHTHTLERPKGRGRRTKVDTIAKKLAADGCYEWLRPDSAELLIRAIEDRAPDKLIESTREGLKEQQLSILVA